MEEDKIGRESLAERGSARVVVESGASFGTQTLSLSERKARRISFIEASEAVMGANAVRLECL